MHPSYVPDKAKKASVFNFQERAAIAEKHMTVKKAAMQRAEKFRKRQTTPDEPSVLEIDPEVAVKHVSLPSVARTGNVNYIVKPLSLELNAGISFPKMKEPIHNIKKKDTSAVIKARNSPDRRTLLEDSSKSMSRATGHSPSQSTEHDTLRAKKSHMSGLHWKSSSGNVVSVEKPVFLTEMEEQVSPSKNVFQNTLIKRENNKTQALQIDADSLIVSASRLCLASHSSSHRSSGFWFDATIALAGISQETLQPVLRYFNRSIAEDINMGHMIAALIKALHDLSDLYQQHFCSWVEEQQHLFMNARLTTQTDWFNNSLKSSYNHIEKLCFVANEVIAFLEEPDIPAHSKCEQIRQDKRDLENMLTLSYEFDVTKSQERGAAVQNYNGEAFESEKLSQAISFDQNDSYSVDLGEESLTEDDSDENVADVSFEHHEIEINVESKSGAPKVSIVVAAARKYLKLKIELRNNVKDGRPSQRLQASTDDKKQILPSRVAYLHTCKAFNVAPLPEIFLSETDDEIELRHYMLGVRGCFALAAGCCKFSSLKRLDLQNCMITVAGCLLLSEAVVNCSKLMYVNLGSCIPTSESGNCEELGVAIANFTITSKTLTVAEFILSHNSLIGIPIIQWDSMHTDVNQHLSKLDLSNCMLGSAACNPLSRVVQKCIKLTSLNLQWNKFNGDAVCRLLDILASHKCLFELDLSWNSCINNKSSEAIQKLLFKNATLSSLNLSSCNIKPMHAIIISAGYMANQTLRKFFIEGNPIGPQGSFAMLKVASSEYNDEVRMMSLGGCNLDFVEIDVELFDFSHPSCDEKNFDLNDEYEWACVFFLCALRCECALEICTKASLNGGSWVMPGKRCDDNLWSLESDTPSVQKEKLICRTKHITEQRQCIVEMVPKTGIVRLSIDYSNPPNIMSDAVFSNNLKLISHTTLEDGALISKKIVKLAMQSLSEALITSKQAKDMLSKIEDESAKAEFIGNIIDKIVDKDDFAPEIDRLPKDIAKKLKRDLKGILAFNPNNASGRYSFDLQLFADRIILKKLMEVNVREKMFRQHQRNGNTSRFFDWENFRNFTLNGHEMSFKASWQIPQIGKVTCDYTCVVRPPKTAKPINQICLEHWIEGLSKFVSVRFYSSDDPVTLPEVHDSFTPHNLDTIFEGVLWLSNNFYLMCAQLERVLHAFLMAGPSIMTHVVQRLFSRVLDLRKFRAVLLKYFSADNYVDVMNRIGWLNAANPYEVDGYYRLDLAIPEQREVAVFLVDLAIQEPGENWQDETYNEKPFELPKSWTNEVPKKHVLSVTYYTGPNCSLHHVRSQWSKKFLFDSSTTEDCSIEGSNQGIDEETDGRGRQYYFRTSAVDQTVEETQSGIAYQTAGDTLQPTDAALLSSAHVAESGERPENINEELQVERMQSTVEQMQDDVNSPADIRLENRVEA